jgi:xanthine dehydrogenase accessory factor
VEDGLSETDLGRFHSPIGLDLKAETPREIALSIMGEITAYRRGGVAAPLAAAKGDVSHAT